MFSDDHMTAETIQELTQTDHSDRISSASDILRCHYDTLCQSFRYPVAQFLYEEGVISKARFFIVNYTAKSLSTRKASFVLLSVYVMLYISTAIT